MSNPDLLKETYDAIATSLPEGEIVAEPTSLSSFLTCIVRFPLKVALSKADFGGFSVSGLLMVVKKRLHAIEAIYGM